MTAQGTTATGTTVALSGQTTPQIEARANAQGCIRIAWPWGEAWRLIGGEWVSL